MGLKGFLKRLERSAESKGIVLVQRDGTRRVFNDTEVRSELFLTKTDLFRGESRSSEVLDAVRGATEESRLSFEEKYKSIEMEVRTIASDAQGGWVDVRKLLFDGTVETVHHEGGSEAALRMKREARDRRS